MGRRGPKPEPASVKLAKGNSGHRPIGVDASPEEQARVAAVVTVRPPTWLKGDGLKVWKRLAPRLVGQKLLFQLDAETFARYCKNFARWLKMQERLDAMGEIYEIETASGVVRRSDPAYMIADRIERQLVTAEASFGLNPAERQRLFAARAAGSIGGLFDGDKPGAGQSRKPVSQPESGEPAVPAVGFLN